jgi:phosphotransferase system HPr (HPr) family protein
MRAPPPSSCAQAGQYDAAVRVAFKGQDVSGLSIMGLMMLAAGIGSTIELPAAGRQARRRWSPCPPWSKASSARNDGAPA